MNWGSVMASSVSRTMHLFTSRMAVQAVKTTQGLGSGYGG